MARRHRLLLFVALVLLTMSGSAQAQAPAPAPGSAPAQPPAGPVYMITFFEVGAGSADQAIGLLRDIAAASRTHDGNAGVLALRESARPGRFAIVELWRDKAAREANASAVTALRDKFQPLFASPFDVRTNYGLDVSGPAIGAESGGDGAVYVLTHVDVFPAGKDQTIELLKALAAASRKETGSLRFEIWQQEGRLNHLPVFEAWRDGEAQRMHAVAEHTRTFRAKLVPLQGALYDERLYTLIR
jgi:quinol monooxygenase YgiN